jgi:probable F420-dependent oxidoreductase
MKFGIALRSMGPSSEADVLLGCARAAEAAGLDDLWIQDHLAIPPDDAEGSNGRYLDPMTTLAWLAPQTERIGLGTGVLILPYRRPLPMAKAVATVQALSGGRVRLGVGVGWMKSEFAALGIPRSRRGADTDAALDLLRRGFGAADDVVEEHGQAFLFRPNPPAPPIYVGGSGEHALRRVVRYGDGWLPMGADPEKLAPAIVRLGELAAEAGRERPEVLAMGALPTGTAEEAAEQMRALEKVGVTGLIAGAGRYERVEEFKVLARSLAAVREAFEG